MKLRNVLGHALNASVLGGGKVTSQLRLLALKARFPGLSTSGSVIVSKGCHIYLHRGGSMHLDGCHLAPGVTLTAGRDAVMRIEADFIGHNATIVSREAIHIGAGSQIAENVVIRDGNHDHSMPLHEMVFTSSPIHIDDDVWLGAASVILAGVKIGTGATVAAGAVVTKDVAAMSTVGGIPARPLKSELSE